MSLQLALATMLSADLATSQDGSLNLETKAGPIASILELQKTTG